ncbi:MAG: winged helix family transcriptional regulator [Alphaproteobacteria bacterium]|nr:MAG: winged helix family transcriptional regulator [Alphaproteobacteria bacterium]
MRPSDTDHLEMALDRIETGALEVRDRADRCLQIVAAVRAVIRVSGTAELLRSYGKEVAGFEEISKSEVNLSAFEERSTAGESQNPPQPLIMCNENGDVYFVRGRPISFAPHEKIAFDLLWQNREEYLSKTTLLDALRKINPSAQPSSVDMLISRLRRKLEINSKLAETVIHMRRRGWRLAPGLFR